MTEPGMRASDDALLRGLIEPVRRYLARRTDPADVDDALVETLTIVWRRHREVEPTLLLPWVYGVARGVLANQYRGRRRRAALSERFRTLDAPRSVVPGPDALLAERDPDLAAACARLSEMDAELIRLWAWEDLAPAEIAVVTGLTADAVSIRLHRAKAKLRTLLSERTIGVPNTPPTTGGRHDR